MTRAGKVAALLYLGATGLGAAAAIVTLSAAVLYDVKLPEAVLLFGAVNGIVQVGVFAAQAWIWRRSA